jgi:hypothetical protein
VEYITCISFQIQCNLHCYLTCGIPHLHIFPNTVSFSLLSHVWNTSPAYLSKYSAIYIVISRVEYIACISFQIQCHLHCYLTCRIHHLHIFPNTVSFTLLFHVWNTSPAYLSKYSVIYIVISRVEYITCISFQIKCHLLCLTFRTHELRVSTFFVESLY